MSNLTLGSLFDGSGGFPLAGMMAGITPIWASEIEPFPIRVTTKRIPHMKHYGDISKMNGGKIEPVDIITFGSPCQNLSLAGKREGLNGEKSSMFFEAIRVIKEMRESTNGEYPRWIVWENVPGAMSSSKGQDFRTVLEEICKIKDERLSVSKPKSGKWTNSGEIMGDAFSVCWRVLDAQYFGVPQRRRRIFLVADFAGECAGKVLFESESVFGNFKKSLCSWQGTAGTAETGIGETGTICLNDQGGDRIDVTQDKTTTLRAQAHHPPCVMFENHSQDTRYIGPLEVSQTVFATFGTGGNNQPFVVEDTRCFDVRFTSDGTKNARQNCYETDTSRTIDTGGNSPDSNQGGVAVVAVQGSMIGRADKNGPQGSGVNEDVSFTLNSTDRHAVAFSQDSYTKYSENEKCGALRAAGGMYGGGSETLVYSTSKNSYHTEAEENLANTLVASDYKDPPTVNSPEYIVRRLTPNECSRLQGFPDWWCADLGTDEPTDEELTFWKDVFETHRKIVGGAVKPKSEKQILTWLKNPHSDSAEYKLWGNGVALPCVYFVLSGIAWVSSCLN